MNTTTIKHKIYPDDLSTLDQYGRILTFLAWRQYEFSVSFLYPSSTCKVAAIKVKDWEDDVNDKPWN